MKQVFIKRLEKLATHLEKGKLGHKKFYFGAWNTTADLTQLYDNGCGTAGCAVGECPFVFPRHWAFKRGHPVLRGVERIPYGHVELNATPVVHSMDFFGLSKNEAWSLFLPYNQPADGKQLRRDATRKQVAANIRAFIKRKLATP